MMATYTCHHCGYEGHDYIILEATSHEDGSVHIEEGCPICKKRITGITRASKASEDYFKAPNQYVVSEAGFGGIIFWMGLIFGVIFFYILSLFI